MAEGMKMQGEYLGGMTLKQDVHCTCEEKELQEVVHVW